MGWNIVYQGDGTPDGLAVHASGRYLTYNDSAFWIHGDTPWSIAAQLTNAQIDTYLNDRQARGFNAIMFNAPEREFTSQTPPYNNVDGVAPFTTTSATAASFESLNDTYWDRVDYIVNGCLSRGIVCFMQPAYLGFGGGSGVDGDQGWDYQVLADSDADLQTYGATLATRYNQGNVVWVMGGDYDGAASVTKQWNIAVGIRSVTPNALISGHTDRNAPTGTEAYPSWSGESNFASVKWVNNIYGGQGSPEFSLMATAYARSPAVPCFLIEGDYENDGNGGTGGIEYRRQVYETWLAGGCGHFFGNSPIWGFGEPNANGGAGAADALANNLDDPITLQMAYVRALVDAYDWTLLEPKTGTEVISSSLGSGSTRICPALASDGTFGLIWVPTSQTVTLVKSAFSPSNIRVRLYDPTAGTYSTHTASTSNSGTLSVATGGERVVVVDAA